MRSPCGSPRAGCRGGVLPAGCWALPSCGWRSQACTRSHPALPWCALNPQRSVLAGVSSSSSWDFLGQGGVWGVHQPCSVRAARPCKTKLSEEQELVRASLHHAARSVRFPGPRSCCHSLVDLAQPRSTWLPGCALQPARPGGGDEQGDVGTACCELLAADCSS